jgi:CarD family transcriptional regulator, regulator of rRNA transcription
VKGPPARHEEPKEQLPAVEGIITDFGELEPGDRVVYPNQGVCRITGVEKKEIAGQKLELVRMEREEDGAAVLVPKGKVPTIGLRKVASGDQIEGVFHYLAAQYDDPELDWKVRHRDNADRLIAGGVLGVAEVVKGLHSLSRIRPLPTKEREQYDNARHLLVHEVAVSLAVPPGVAEDYIDYALMPPAGVKFDLKPPPTPVLMPSRPKKRRPVAEEEEGGGLADLGLGDLGIDLGALDGALEGAEGVAPDGVPAVEGVEAEGEAEGEGEGEAEGAEEVGDEEEAPPPPASKAVEKRSKPPPPPQAKKEKKEKRVAAAKPAEKKAKAPRKAAEKPAAKKAPAKKAAAEKPSRAAPRRGGKKK